MSEMNLKKIKLANLINLDKKEAFYDIFVKIGTGNTERFIKYGKSEYNNYDVLVSLNSKKISEVYLSEESYEKYIISKENQFNQFENADIKNKQKVIDEFIKDKNLLKEVLSDVCVIEEDKVKQIDGLKNKNIDFLKKIGTLGNLYEMYEVNNNQSIIKKQMETFIIINILEKIGKYSKAIIEEFTVALLLSDLLLNEDEYWLSQKGNKKQLNKKLLNHGSEILNLIPKDTLKSFSISFIKDHHEKPDGTGFPNSKTCKDLNFFTALYIIVEDFVSTLISHNCKTNKYGEVFAYIEEKYSVYLDSEFENALLSFLGNVNKNEFLKKLEGVK